MLNCFAPGLESRLPGQLMIQWHPPTGGVIPECQGNQEQQPNYSGYRCKMQKAAASLDVHEEKCNHDRPGNGHRERNNKIKGTKLDIGDGPGQGQQCQQGDAMCGNRLSVSELLLTAVPV